MVFAGTSELPSSTFRYGKTFLHEMWHSSVAVLVNRGRGEERVGLPASKSLA
jgi:hypothetical protein